jgi:hypothetical protein
MSNSPYYYQPQNAPQANKGSGGNKTLKIVLIVGGILMLLCCGGGVAAVFVIRGMVNEGLAMTAKSAVESSQEAKEAIGDVESARLNLKASTERGDRSAVIDVHGSKGDAKMIINEDKKTGMLELPNGSNIPLTIRQ